MMPSTSSFSPQWKQETTRLSCAIGPFHIGAFTFNVRSTRRYTPEPIQTLQELAPLLSEPQAQELDGHLLYSHSVLGISPSYGKLNHHLCYVPAVFDKYGVDLTMGPDAYWSGNFSAKSRANMRRLMRSAEPNNAEQLHWQHYCTPQDWQIFHPFAHELSLKTYQHHLFKGGIPGDESFFKDRLNKAAQGKVHGYLLFQQNQPIAYLFLESDDDDVLALAHLGYAPDCAKQSPGTLLMALAINQQQQVGCYSWLDFGFGEGQHKQTFSTGTRRAASIYLLKNTLHNRLKLQVHRIIWRLNHQLQKLLKGLGVHAAIKKWVRAKAVT